MVRSYLTDSPQLRGVVLLLDVRHDPTRDDLEFMEFLAEAGLPVLIAVTKVDKVSSEDTARRLQGLSETLDVGEDQLLAVSSRTGRGIPELERAIATLLESQR
jgi:GTP-binding protein